MFDNYLDKVILMVIVTFLFTAIIIPLVIKIAYHIGAIDIPKDNRRVHTKPMPKLGGLGIFAGFLFGYMLFGENTVQMNSILIGSFIIILTGLLDDIKTMSAKQQLIGQLLAALVIVFYGNIMLEGINIFGSYIELGWLSYPITIFFILGCVNVINLIDGLDGLSSGISAIFFLTIGVIAFLQGKLDTLEIILAFVMLGSISGFLIYNFNPAKVFVGDAGTLFMGFIIAIVSLLGYKGTMVTSFLVPLMILAIPILDTLFAIVRRIVNKKPIYEGDKDHMHHQFLKMNFSQRKTVLIVYFINILFSLATIFSIMGDETKSTIIYLILLVSTIWFILHTGIISDNVRKKVEHLEKEKFDLRK